MKITVISDTHGNFDVLYDIVRKNQDTDTFIHLGDGENEYYDVQSSFYDKPFIFIKGNCDYGNYRPNLVTELGGKKFYMCHGNTFEPSGMKEFIRATAVTNGCEIALFGHTHVPCCDMWGGVLLFNPGSPSLPRGGHPPTYGIITIMPNGSINAVHIAL